jgi:hypothetical protein
MSSWGEPIRTERTWLEVDVDDFELPTGLTDTEVLAEMPTEAILREADRRLRLAGYSLRQAVVEEGSE